MSYKANKKQEERGDILPSLFDKLTPEERRELGRKGGIKSGESKRKKKARRETLELLLEMPLKKGKVADIEKIKSFTKLMVAMKNTKI